MESPYVFKNMAASVSIRGDKWYDQYEFVRWKITRDGTELTGTELDTSQNVGTPDTPGYWCVPKFDISGDEMTVTAIFDVDPAKARDKKVLETVALYQPNGTTLMASGNRQGTAFTITLPANTDTRDLANMLLKLTVSEYATVKKSGDTDNWPAEGKACGMELDKATTFTVTAENNTTQDHTVTITKAKSSEKNITAAVLLNQTGDTTPLAVGTVSEDKIIFTLPANTDKAVLNSIGMKYLKLTYPETATAKMVNSDGQDAYDDTTDPSKWRNGDVMCNMSLNTPVKFIITAEDGTTKTYTAEIKYTAPNAPTLSNGSTARSSKTAATVKFTTNEAGTYYYKVVNHGAAAPTVDEIKKSTTKGTASAGETNITLSNLTEDARDIYIVVVSASGAESTVLKIEIPAYGGGTETPDTGKFTITANAPKGGTITTNRAKADKSDEIIVTVTPDSGYQMVAGSLTYSLAVAGGETVKITNNRFTMPGGNVTITCQWETATMEDDSTKTYTVTVYMDKGTLADQFWDKLTDFVNQVPWWEYAKHQQSSSSYPKYW